jgi:glycosyltransferase involved in cell wall biosynthesis
LLLRRLARRPARFAVALAPRGEFSTGALNIKPARKQLFLTLAQSARLYHGIVWQATADKEAQEIRNHVGADAATVLVPDPPAVPRPAAAARAREHGQPLRMVFLSRIARMKNLEGALRVLMQVRGAVEFSIYGPLEDPQYWQRCQGLLAALPANVVARYHGALPPERVGGVLLEQDLLFLPTLGENFGHIVSEAWACGCPVLISDRTPWRGLAQRGIGWDLPLDSPGAFAQVIEQCARMDEATYAEFRGRARAYAEALYRSSRTGSAARSLFDRALQARAARGAAATQEQ